MQAFFLQKAEYFFSIRPSVDRIARFDVE